MWITQLQAAEILGCDVSLIGKLVAKGELTSRVREGRASLDRDQVLEMRVKREPTCGSTEESAEAAQGLV